MSIKDEKAKIELWLNNVTTLEKGWKGNVAGIAMGLAGLGSNVKISDPPPPTPHTITHQQAPKPPPAPTPDQNIPQAPKHQHVADIFEGLYPDLNFISQLESSHGKNINHAKNSKGEFHTAYGHLGFKPVTAFEIYNRAKDIQKQYPNLKTSDDFLKAFKSNPRLYNSLASKFWQKMKTRLGSPEKTAYGWRWGINAAKKASDQQIESDPYVKKFKQMYNSGLYKSEDFGNAFKSWLESQQIVPEESLGHDFGNDEPDESVRELNGNLLDLNQYLEAARKLACKLPVDQHVINRALSIHNGHPVLSALHAYELPQNNEHIKALEAFIELQNKDLNKSESSVQVVTSELKDGEDVAQAVQRAFYADSVKKVNLHGKHSQESLVAKDPESNRAYLIKPDDHKVSPAMGVSDLDLNQPVREAAFYHIALVMDLVSYFPRAEIINIDEKQWVALKLLSPDFKTFGKIKSIDTSKPKEILQPYLDRGIVYKWAFIDMFLGNPDRHDSNIMANSDGRVVLIDQGSAMAGRKFNPAKDPNSFVPYYLRVWGPDDFMKLHSIEKLKALPKLSLDIDNQLKDWIKSINIQKVFEVFDEYKINKEPFIERFNMIANYPGPVYIALNRFWSGVGL